MKYHLQCLLSQGLISDSQLTPALCAHLVPDGTPEAVATAALALLIVGRQRVPDLEAGFLARRDVLRTAAGARQAH